MSEPERWHLILKPLDDAVPAEVRLRRLLKAALRSYRIRVVSAWIEGEGEAASDDDRPAETGGEDNDPTPPRES